MGNLRFFGLCSNCGRIVLFFGTNVRRHSPNGKNIYRFAIYKCEKNHTWNEKLAIYKAFTDHREVPDTEFSEEITPLLFSPCIIHGKGRSGSDDSYREYRGTLPPRQTAFRTDRRLEPQPDCPQDQGRANSSE